MKENCNVILHPSNGEDIKLPRTYSSEGEARDAAKSVVRSYRMKGKIVKGETVDVEVIKSPYTPPKHTYKSWDYFGEAHR